MAQDDDKAKEVQISEGVWTFHWRKRKGASKEVDRAAGEVRINADMIGGLEVGIVPNGRHVSLELRDALDAVADELKAGEEVYLAHLFEIWKAERPQKNQRAVPVSGRSSFRAWTIAVLSSALKDVEALGAGLRGADNIARLEAGLAEAEAAVAARAAALGEARRELGQNLDNGPTTGTER